MATLYLLLFFFSSIPIFSVLALPPNFPDSEQILNPNPNLSLKPREALESDKTVATPDLWCVAKNNAEDAALQSALDWACGAGGSDCRPIQQGGSCSDPTDIQSFASYAFNDYYLRNGLSPQSCDFSGTAALTSLNPSHGSCVFPSSTSARNGSFTGTATGAIYGVVGPAGADLNNSPIAFKCASLLIIALLMLTAASIFQ
ncbi:PLASMODESMATA CALLOSE-BINDING PROTEIN 2-like [Tasmannia lanceolata]|uniref:PLASMODESMATA CALLOSE-BINDING PROTEIN 2-like n=1 Tax=Tasmannia lanceolata TaxID=3420 RepID=UPI00406360C8